MKLKKLIAFHIEQLSENGININRMNPKDIDLLIDYINTIPSIIWVNDFEQLSPSVLNNYGLEYYGYTNQDLKRLGFNLYNDLIHPDNFSDIHSSMNSFVENPQQTLIQPYHAKTKNGSYRWTIACMKALNYTASGTPKFVFSITFDIEDLVKKSTENKTILPINKQFVEDNIHAYNQLSEREIETLKLIGMAHTSSEIANKMGISESTVVTHRAHIMRKLNAKNINEIVKFAILFHPEII